MWLKGLEISIEFEKILLSEGGWLNTELMDAVFHLPYRDYLELVGFQEHVCRLDQKLSKGKELQEVKNTCLQFYHVSNVRHWILLYFYPPEEHLRQCYVYDSLGSHELDFNLLENIGILWDISVTRKFVHQQINGSSCGPLSIAMAIDVAHHIDPEDSLYDMKQLCKHLHTCFINDEIIPFPKKQQFAK